MLPPQPFTDALLRRGMVAWFAIRGLVFLAGLPIGAGLVIDIVAAPIIVILAAFVVRIDLRVAREDILLANLGISPVAITIVAMAFPLALEGTAQALTSLLIGAR